MKRRTKRTPVPSGKLPGLSVFESNRIRHAVGQIDDLKDPNLFASALVLEAKGICRALGNTAAVVALDAAIDALEPSEIREMASALASRRAP